MGGQIQINNNKKRPQGMGMGGKDQTNQIIQSMNTKLMINNFPSTHTKDMIQQICEVFGKVKSVDLLKDPATGEFRG